MSKKSKFVLTKDLIRVEKEIQQNNVEKSSKLASASLTSKGRISLDIDESLKTKFQIYCITHKITMTEMIENMIEKFIV